MHFVTLWPFDLIFTGGRGIVVDYLCGEFSDFLFQLFWFYRADRQNHRQRWMIAILVWLPSAWVKIAFQNVGPKNLLGRVRTNSLNTPKSVPYEIVSKLYMIFLCVCVVKYVTHFSVWRCAFICCMLVVTYCWLATHKVIGSVSVVVCESCLRCRAVAAVNVKSTSLVQACTA